jgi:hypothetical protein
MFICILFTIELIMQRYKVSTHFGRTYGKYIAREILKNDFGIIDNSQVSNNKLHHTKFT